MYTSTRKQLNLTGEECILKGISDDKGLFINSNFNEFKLTKDLLNKTYQELSVIILKFFLPTFTNEELEYCVNNAYNSTNFKEKIVDIKTFGNIAHLELFYGPTMAFKDMALTLTPYLMEVAKKKIGSNKKTCILTATSGDTGGACLSGFSNLKDANVIVLYPTKGVSPFQEKQMHYYANENRKVIAVDGNFDDCQRVVKEIFNESHEFKNIFLTSANSINIGRLIPQVIYYFYSYFEMVRRKEIKYGELINYSIPTGNFGNILACYISKQMGLPIGKIICASNENNVLTDFFNTLTYDANRSFHVTNSPAMDILISSNLERLLYLITNKDYKLVSRLMTSLNSKGKFVLPDVYKENLKDFLCFSINSKNTINYIEFNYNRNNYLMDPHTAVSYGAYMNLKDKLTGKTIIVSTASPLKFIETVNEVFKINKKDKALVNEIAKLNDLTVPDVINEIYDFKVNKKVVKLENIKEELRKIIGKMDEVR